MLLQDLKTKPQHRNAHDLQVMMNFLDVDAFAFIPWCWVRIGTSTGNIFHCFYEYVCFASLLYFRSCVKIGPCRVFRLFGLLLVRFCFCHSLLLIFCGNISLNPGPVRYPCIVCYELISGLCCVIRAKNGLTVPVVEFLLQNG